MKLKVIVNPKKSPLDLEIKDDSTLGQLKIAFCQQKKIAVNRQCFKIMKKDKFEILEDDSRKLSSFGVNNDSELVFKDFGPQIGYRTVFILEYLGPLVFVLVYALRPAFIYGKDAAMMPFHPTAKLGILCWTIHFLKREFETFFIHRFSRPTMPLFNLFKNCAYYWSFGLVIGYPLCHPQYTSPQSTLQINIGLAIFVVSEFLNFLVHFQLRMLRTAEGSKERPIPGGPLFSLVTCPNYTFEVLGWLGFSIFSQIFGAYAFTVLGFLQMTDWALKKHRNYIKSYGSKYKELKRKAIVPFAL